MKASVSVGIGELYDKISILEIKSERITDPIKLKNVYTELSLLQEESVKFPVDATLYGQLKDVNMRLWDVEDAIRMEESKKAFGEEFIRLARSVYELNDERAAIKQKINLASGSDIVEVKEYNPY
jgi:hypothetical protein